eukprot:4301696-Prymnesium_polylepis.1
MDGFDPPSRQCKRRALPIELHPLRGYSVIRTRDLPICSRPPYRLAMYPDLLVLGSNQRPHG